MRRFFRIIAKIIFFPVTEKNVSYLKRTRNFIHSQIVLNWINFNGKDISICYPCQIRGGKFITVGNNFTCRGGMRLEAIDSYGIDTFTPEVVIGSNVAINNNCHIGCINKIHIGDNVVIASGVFVTDHYHGSTSPDELAIPVAERRLYSKGPVIICDNVWIGEGVVILAGVNIGKNAVIGANSVVTKDIPENSIAAGVPAKVLRYK